MSNPKCPFTLEDLKQRGSRWVLANFHTHTPGSRDYAKALLPSGRRSPKDIARGILEDCRSQGVMVLAVTDHNSPSFVRVKTAGGSLMADPESESYYAMMRTLVKDEQDRFGNILVLPGVEIGAENIHVLGIFAPSNDPGWDVLKIAAILSQGNCPPDFYGDHLKSCTDFSVADAIDIIHERGGVAIPAHIDGASGFLKEETQKRLLKLIVSRPHLFAVEYLEDRTRAALERLLSTTDWKDIFTARQGNPIAWTQSCDAHFVRAFNPKQGGNGKAIGTKSRRTWLRLDPEGLSFEAVRAALMDPQNRVRVDKTLRPRGRQGAYQAPPPDRTYVRALHIDWGGKLRDDFRFNNGINTIVGPIKAGKTVRARAFSVIGGSRKNLSVSEPKNGDEDTAGRDLKLKSADMILERGANARSGSLWWLHREAPERIFVAEMEVQGGRLRTRRGTRGKWVDLLVKDKSHPKKKKLDPYALRRHLWDLSPQLAPSVPRPFTLKGMEAMLKDSVRVARFIEWNYVPDSLVADHRRFHKQLRSATEHPGAMTATELAAKLKALLAKLEKPRKEARAALKALYKDSLLCLEISHKPGKWRQLADRREVARNILALKDRTQDAVFKELKAIEDRVQIQLRTVENEKKGKGGKQEKADKYGESLTIALKGLFLVIGGRALGPIVLDAPELYFQPAELVETLAPLLLNARDTGAQFILSIDDTNFPFAVDTDMLFVCRRASEEGRVGPLDHTASGGLEKGETATWALQNLDGGGDLFARRGQHYSGVLGPARAESQRKVADVLLAMSERKRASRRKGR